MRVLNEVRINFARANGLLMRDDLDRRLLNLLIRVHGLHFHLQLLILLLLFLLEGAIGSVRFLRHSDSATDFGF